MEKSTKFTNTGKITIKMDYLQVDAGNIELNFSVEDTGIGIKKEDRHKLFRSFQQLKRTWIFPEKENIFCPTAAEKVPHWNAVPCIPHQGSPHRSGNSP